MILMIFKDSVWLIIFFEKIFEFRKNHHFYIKKGSIQKLRHSG